MLSKWILSIETQDLKSMNNNIYKFHMRLTEIRAWFIEEFINKDYALNLIQCNMLMKIAILKYSWAKLHIEYMKYYKNIKNLNTQYQSYQKNLEESL